MIRKGKTKFSSLFFVTQENDSYREYCLPFGWKKNMLPKARRKIQWFFVFLPKSKIFRSTVKWMDIWTKIYQRVTHNYLDWAKYQNRHSSKSIWVMKLFFSQNSPLMGQSFWQIFWIGSHVCIDPLVFFFQ